MSDEYRAAAQRLIQKFRRAGDPAQQYRAPGATEATRRDAWIVNSPTDCVFIVNHNYAAPKPTPEPPPAE